MFLYQPKRSDRKVRVVRATDPAKEAKGAVDHMSEGWLPANPKLLKQIQENIQNGNYTNNPDKLIHDLKKDPALFFHGVRNLRGVVENLEIDMEPIEELRKLEDEKLEKIFSISAKDLSTHQFHRATKIQAKQLQFSLFSSNAAEKIAPKVSRDPELAFSSASFRQLGIHLIAWNYPTIYARVLSAHRVKGANIDFELQKMLGVSPLQVGMRFASKWGMGSAIKRALSPVSVREKQKDASDNSIVDVANMSLQDICEVSELYAQMQDPETFPHAEEIWVNNEAIMTQLLDEQAMHDIEAQVRESCLTHQDTTLIMASVPVLEKAVQVDEAAHHKDDLLRRNTYLQRCPDFLIDKFNAVYQQLEESRMSVDAIRTLVDAVIPAAGFVRGCLFLLDADTLELRPALRIGDRPLSNYRSFMYDSRNGIMASLHSSFPLKREAVGITGRSTSQICGPLQNTNYPGVLYLEVDENSDEDPTHNANNYFHAICQAINDCFGAAKG
ncbi:hypothetical protein OAO01_01940 [Oligoflexia bacterium]|nr:hypothetical protein [Oligoflexia bacterium]